MTAARRIYRRMLRVLPARLRDEHGLEMEEAFVDALAHARTRGHTSAAAAWVRAAADIVTVAMRRRLTVSPGFLSFTRERRLTMIGSDVKFAVRSFRRQPSQTLLVVAMLSLGIAANVVVFSLINGYFLRPFPFPHPDRLVYLNETAPQWNLEVTGINFPDYAAWKSGATSFEGLALYASAAVTLADGVGAERVDAGLVTHNFMDVLGVAPLIGRMFTPEEDTPGGRRVVVISEGLWRERFGADAQIAGKTLRMNGVALDIVGVMPQRAVFPDTPRLWLAIQGNPNQTGTNYTYSGIGRLKSGVSVAEAAEDLRRSHSAIWAARDQQRIVSPIIMPLRDRFVGNMRPIARALAAAVAMLLIVACANVAAVMLARAVARRKEMSIRLAVGAARGRLLRQLLIENTILAAAGGIGGLVLGRWILSILIATATTQLPAWASFDLDVRVAVFAVLIAIATSVLFGWGPALHAIRGDLRGPMNESTSGLTASPRAGRALSWLVAAEYALVSVLLVCAGLLLLAFNQVRRVDPGFDTARVLTVTVALPPALYRDTGARLAFWNRALDRLRAIPGVAAAGNVTCAPLTGCHSGNLFNVEGARALGRDEAPPIVLMRGASDGYLEAMGIPLASGRAFSAREGRDAGIRSVIVNESFVRTFWPGTPVADAIGRRLAFRTNVPEWHTVVGVSRDIRHYGLEQPVKPALYFPNPAVTRPTMTFALRTTGSPEALAEPVRNAFRELDASLALYRMKTTSAMLEESLNTRKVYSWMLGIFATLALVLAVGGTYGVTSYLITQRRREIGIRVAVGAARVDILRALLGSTARLLVPAVAAGLAGSVLVAGLMQDLLFGVSTREPVVLAIAAAILLAVAVIATVVPAQKAARTNPVTALRI